MRYREPWASEGGARGAGGRCSPWVLKFIAKKECFLSFEWEKTNFTTFCLLEKKLEKSPSGFLWKKSFQCPCHELLSWASLGERNEHSPRPRELGLRNKNLENLASASWFWWIDIFLAITLYLPVWHSHYTRASFTILVWCNDELAVHSWPHLCLQNHVA